MIAAQRIHPLRLVRGIAKHAPVAGLLVMFEDHFLVKLAAVHMLKVKSQKQPQRSQGAQRTANPGFSL
jgi:hypothetical protein